MNRIRFCLLVLLLLAAMPLTAQTDLLVQTVTSTDNTLTVYYPRNWTAYPRGNGILLGNDMSALNYYATMPLNSGEFVMRIESPSAVVEEHGGTLQAITVSISAAEGGIASESLLINGQTAKRITISDARAVIVFPLGEALFNAAQLYTAPGELGDYDEYLIPILEAITYRAPVARPAPRNELVRGLLPRYEGSDDIPIQFDYPDDWFISESADVGDVYVSNEDLDRYGASEDALIIGFSVTLDTIRDPIEERDRSFRRFWSSGAYGDAETLDTGAWAGVYAVEFDDSDYDFDFSYFVSADLYFETGVIFATAVGFTGRDYEEDEDAIFTVLESVRIVD
ncbi:MAG: hypothetical protein IAE80_12280 [Anaerolinea sp.]|nr:hypothetical protein [Anaerolinea sp.]